MDFYFTDADEPLAGRADHLDEGRERFFAALDAMEIDVVVSVVAAAERARLRRFALAATSAGNGWLYPMLSLILMGSGVIDAPLRFLAASLSAVICGFAAYPVLKAHFKRLRPCDYDASLARIPEPIDHYSFPSGHSMIAAAWGTSLAFDSPAAIPVAVALFATIGWSRIALGHHYPSDVAAGGLLGVMVAALTAALAY